MKNLLPFAITACLLASCSISETGNSRRVSGVPFLTGFAPSPKSPDNRKVEQLLEARPRVVSTEFFTDGTHCIVKVENPGSSAVYYSGFEEGIALSTLENWEGGEWHPEAAAQVCGTGLKYFSIPPGESRELTCHFGTGISRRRAVVRMTDPTSSRVWNVALASYPY